jgi:uncharacterized protein with PIN domain
MATVTFTIHGNLLQLLKKRHGTVTTFTHEFERRASIKDVIESLGIPHPVIGNLTVNGLEVGFDYILLNNDKVETFPLIPPVNPLIPTRLRPDPLESIRFIVDVNVGRLALLLRMFGFDTLYGNDMRDTLLVEIASLQDRIILTRDISLLKRKHVMHGYLVREQEPEKQLIEILLLYDLGGMAAPLNRCIPCNGLLVPVDKETIINRLEPLTKKYYHSFHICQECEKIYWTGSHQQKMKKFIDNVLKAVGEN